MMDGPRPSSVQLGQRRRDGHGQDPRRLGRTSTRPASSTPVANRYGDSDLASSGATLDGHHRQERRGRYRQAYNGAPQVDGFTSTGNTVGVSTPTAACRAASHRPKRTLSGMDRRVGTTYKIDLSTYLGTGDYLAGRCQLGLGQVETLTQWLQLRHRQVLRLHHRPIRTSCLRTMLKAHRGTSPTAAEEGYYPYGLQRPSPVTAGTHTYNGGERRCPRLGTGYDYYGC